MSDRCGGGITSGVVAVAGLGHPGAVDVDVDGGCPGPQALEPGTAVREDELQVWSDLVVLVDREDELPRGVVGAQRDDGRCAAYQLRDAILDAGLRAPDRDAEALAAGPLDFLRDAVAVEIGA